MREAGALKTERVIWSARRVSYPLHHNEPMRMIGRGANNTLKLIMRRLKGYTGIWTCYFISRNLRTNHTATTSPNSSVRISDPWPMNSINDIQLTLSTSFTLVC